MGREGSGGDALLQVWRGGGAQEKVESWSVCGAWVMLCEANAVV